VAILYTRLKIFHFQDKINSLPLENEKILPPLHIRIKPTNVCEHNCWYCAYTADKQQLGKDMVTKDYIPKEKMMEIIDDIDDMGVKALTFSGGGDPFYYPYLLDAVKKLSNTSVKFASLTNGAELEGEIAEVFAHSATWLRISIDGWDDDSYSKYRGVKKGVFTKIINNMKDFKKLSGKCYLGVSLIVDKINATHVYDFLERLKDVGVDSVKVAPCIVSNCKNENNEYHKRIFNCVKEQVKKAIEELADENYEIFDSYHELGEKFEKEYSWCPFIQILPVIGADLNVYPCHDKAYNIDEGSLGSIKEQRFKEFWLSDKNKFFKIDPTRHCNHHCVMNTNNKLVLEYLNTEREHLEFI
jgi:MoaA/NifB/PqqE/SkfB family radical SAM enzyme